MRCGSGGLPPGASARAKVIWGRISQHEGLRRGRMLAVINCIYLPPTYLHFIQDIEDRCLLLTISMNFVDFPIQEH
jgi:hypothetical protein